MNLHGGRVFIISSATLRLHFVVLQPSEAEFWLMIYIRSRNSGQLDVTSRHEILESSDARSFETQRPFLCVILLRQDVCVIICARCDEVELSHPYPDLVDRQHRSVHRRHYVIRRYRSDAILVTTHFPSSAWPQRSFPSIPGMCQGCGLSHP